MNRWWQNRYLTLFSRFILGGVFVAAAVSKIQDPPSFAHMVYNYKILPDYAVNGLALLLPWLELICGTLLIFGGWKRTSAGLLALLLLLFIGALAFNLSRDHAVDCGCFDLQSAGKSHEELIRDMQWVVVRDIALLLLAGQIVLATKEPALRLAGRPEVGGI